MLFPTAALRRIRANGGKKLAQNQYYLHRGYTGFKIIMVPSFLTVTTSESVLAVIPAKRAYALCFIAVCVCLYIDKHTHTHIYIYIYIYEVP